MYRPLLIAGLLILAPALLATHAEIVSPLTGAQLVGIAPLEVSADGEVAKVTFYVDGAIVGIVRQPPFRILHDFGSTLKPHLITAEVVADGFKVVERLRVTTSGPTVNDTIEVNLVEVPVRGRGHSRVQPSDIRVTENGAPQTILEVRERRGETTFIFVVDRSLSMGDGKLDAALRAVREAVANLRPGDDAQLVLFNHRPETPIAISGAASLEAIEPAGGTALRDTLDSISPRRRSAIIVITDGGDRNSTTSREEASRAVSRANASVYGLTLGGGDGSDFLHDVAARTGGQVTRTTAATMTADMRNVIEEINSRYVVVYQSTLTSPGWREIEIASARRGLSLAASKRGYFAR